jgi:carboxypeptidase family protein/TonB-dependent receptor-like protein
MYLNVKRRAAGVACLYAVALLLTPQAFTQTLTTGDVSGTITDASGAVVPNATVTLKATQTDSTRTTVSNGSGQYRFSLLSPAEYTISAVTAGLKSGVTRVNVLVGENLEVNLGLTVQGAQEVVEVTAEAAVLQTENANLTTAFSNQQVADLPMAGGDITTLAMTVPGVRVNVKGGSGNMNANGVPGSSMLFTLNGADVMDPYNNLNNSGASNNLLGANEVAEVAVILNAFSAQYGRMAGGQENIVGKSGSNSFHGNIYNDYNSQLLNARDFFVAQAGNRKTRSDAHQYGAGVGGPIKKNKLFFYVNTEGLRYVLPATTLITLPSTQLLNYALAHVPAAAVPLYTQAANLYKNAPGAAIAVPASGNKLGCQTSGTFAGTPTGTGGTFGVDTPCAVVYTSSNNQLNTEGLFIGRGDYNINDKQKISARYEYDWGVQATGTSPIAPAFNSVSTQPQHAGQLNHSWVISPNVVNNFIGGASWYSAIFGVADFSKVQALMPERFTFADGGGTAGGITGVGSGGGQGTAGIPNGRNVGQLQLIDDLSWTRGRHTLKVGFNYRFNKVTATNLSSAAFAGTYTFNDLTDFATGKINSTGKGSNFAQSFPLLAAAHIRAYSLNFYAQDEWNVTRNLKLTYGMRFERDGNPACLDNCFAGMAQEFGTTGYQGGASIPYNQTIVTGMHNAYNSLESVIPEPRFSFAWTPFGDGKTVIRGGVGLFANLFAVSVANSIDTNAPSVFSPTVTTGEVGLLSDPNSSLAAAYGSAAAFQNGFTKGYTLAQLQAALPAGVAFAKPGFYSTPQNFAAPKVLQWNFEIEHPLTPHNVLSVTYTGNHGYDEQLTNADANSFVSPTSVYAATGFAGLPVGAAPDPRFLTVTDVLLSGKSNYDAMIVQIRHAMSHGFQAQMGWTWSHALGNVAVYDPNNIHLGYGPLAFDTRHMLTGDLLWDSPRFTNPALQWLAGNWTLGAKFYAYTGSPFSVTNSSLSARVNSAGGIGNSFLSDVVDNSALGVSCSSSAVVTPIAGAPAPTACLTAAQFQGTTTQTNFGNTAPDMFRGTGYFDVDLRAMKNIPIRERVKLGVGAQFYNLFNHPNFANPSGSVTSSALGTISTTVVPPTSIYGSFQSGTVSGRVVVATLKLNF